MVNIAVCAPLTGRAAQLGREMVQAVGLAVADQPAADGLAIGLKVYDDEGDPIVAARIARELAVDNSIIGCVGNYGSDTTLAAAKIFAPYGLTLVIPVASNPMLTEAGLENAFRYTNRDDHTAHAIAGYLFQTLGKRRAVVVRTLSAYGESMSLQFIKAFSALGGVVRGIFSVEEGAPDFSSTILHWPKNSDLAFYGGTFEGASFLRALRQAGYKQLMATGDGCWDQVNFVEPAGDILQQGEGVLVLSASSAVGKTEASKSFARKYVTRFGNIGNYALNCYDAAMILIDAVVAAHNNANGTFTRANVRDTLRNVQFTGAANSNLLQWDKKGDNQNAITVLSTTDNGHFQEIANIVNLRSSTSGNTQG